MNKIKPFFVGCCANPYPTAYDETLSYYEEVCKIAYKLNEVIQSQNGIVTSFEQILEWVNTQLKTYTIDQLQEWLDDGTLENLLTNALEIARTYNTTQEILQIENLQSGTFLKSLGYSSINDGGVSWFIVSDSETQNTYNFNLPNGKYLSVINPNNLIKLGLKNTTVNSSLLDILRIYTNEIDLNECTLNLTEQYNVENLKLYNGSVSFGNNTGTQPLYDIALNLGSNVTLENISMSNLNVSYFIYAKSANNILINKCNFQNIPFNCIYFDTECENITVKNCSFDTITWSDMTTFNYRYFVASGSRYLKDSPENENATFMVKNFRVENNIFSNNPYWEAMDCHGGENVYFINNKCSNCYVGIMASLDTRFINNPVFKNVYIIGNDLTSSTSANNGIVAGGARDSTGYGENYYILNNKINGFSTINNYGGAILIRNSKNMNIIGNEINNPTIASMLFYGINRNVVIKNNRIEAGSNNGCIVINGYGNINYLIENNILMGNDTSTTPYAITLLNAITGKIGYNTYGNVTNTLRYPHLIDMTSTNTSNFLGYAYNGMILESYDNNNRWKCTTPLRYNASSFNNAFALSGTTGNNYFTYTGNAYEIIVGMQFQVNSETYVCKDIDASRIYTTSPLTSNYSNVSPTPLLPSWSQLS